jgi:hypothetical protein
MADDEESTEQPVAQDLGAFQKSLMEEFDKRIRGLQGSTDRRMEEFKAELANLKTADLSPEEREQEQAAVVQRELDRVRRENELLKMRKGHPDEVDFLEQFLGASSLDEQLKLLADFRKPKAVAEESEEEPEPEKKVTPVDKNNSPRKTGPLNLAELGKGPMSAEFAKRLLEASGNEKGALTRLRRANS